MHAIKGNSTGGGTINNSDLCGFIRHAIADGEDEPLTFPEIEEEHCSARTPDGPSCPLRRIQTNLWSFGVSLRAPQNVRMDGL